MYASLDEVDLVGQDADGQRVALQTDGREPLQISAESHVAIVMGAARAINPYRHEAFAGVRFVFASAPPAGYASFLAATGADIEVGGTIVVQGSKDDAKVDLQVNEALSILGAQVWARHHLEPSPEALTALEQVYLAASNNASEVVDSQGLHWSRVIELSAAFGILLADFGHVWARELAYAGTIPYVLKHEGHIVNVIGRIERFFAHGISEAPSTLLALLDEQNLSGPTMLNLRPTDWVARDIACCWPLLDNASPDVPLVALVVDLPQTTRTISKSDLDEAGIAALKAEATANLQGVTVEIATVRLGRRELLVVHGDYYASEKLMDRAFMQRLHERLGSTTLVATVPVKGQLHIARTEDVTQLALSCIDQHDEAPPNQRISKMVFTVTDGEVVGASAAVLGVDGKVVLAGHDP